jgi:hypothetical protein
MTKSKRILSRLPQHVPPLLRRPRKVCQSLLNPDTTVFAGQEPILRSNRRLLDSVGEVESGDIAALDGSVALANEGAL